MEIALSHNNLGFSVLCYLDNNDMAKTHKRHIKLCLVQGNEYAVSRMRHIR